MRREAEREVESQAEAMAVVIRTVLNSLNLPEEAEFHALEILASELRRFAAGSVT